MKKSITFVCLALAIAVPSAAPARADVGSDNATGIAGPADGEVTTGCSYSTLTGNAYRSITDIVIAGSVGAYPLAFTRTMNSRYTAGLPPQFGPAGSWTHSYQWSIDPVTVVKTYLHPVVPDMPLPVSYNVNYPDGRRVISVSHFDRELRQALKPVLRIRQDACVTLSFSGQKN